MWCLFVAGFQKDDAVSLLKCAQYVTRLLTNA
jgi:hypothetical protein